LRAATTLCGMWQLGRLDRRAAPWRRRFVTLTQVLVFGVVTAVLCGCGGVLKSAPDPAGSGSAQPTATAPADTYSMTFEEFDPYETEAEALARKLTLELRMLNLAPITVAIGKVLGPGWSEEKLSEIAVQAIGLCPNTLLDPEPFLISNGVPGKKAKAVLKAACHAP
jgi:hypothetical protein